MKMTYQQAERIRGKSFGSLLGEQEGGLGTSLKKTLSIKGKARMTGIKEKFDPLNIAKFLTGGSNFAPAALGKLFGRSKEDIARFSGSRLKDLNTPTATKIDSLESENKTLDMLMKIYEFMQKSQEDKIQKREAENAFAEEKEMEKNRRHKELIDALLGKKVSSESIATKESKGLFDVLPDFNFRINPARSIAKASAGAAAGAAAQETAKAGTEKATKETIKKSASKQLGKTIGKGALKSIPILGLAIGAGFAIGRLIEGDVVGAGIDVASGVGSALTSIPLTLTNAARDVYKDVYGNYPDPTNPKDQENLSEILTITKEVASELLNNSAVPVDNDIQYDALGNAMQGVPMSGESSSKTKSPTKMPASAVSQSPISTTTGTPSAVSQSPISTTTGTPSAAPTPSTTNTSSPIESTPSSDVVNKVTTENLDMSLSANKNINSNDLINSTVINNNISSQNNQQSTQDVKPIPSVRNTEETYMRMIMYSTVVV